MSQLTYRKVVDEDCASIRNFLRDNFYSDEPLNQSIGDHLPTEAEQNLPIKVGKLGCSTIAVDAEGKIAGVRLAYPQGPSDIIQAPKQILSKDYDGKMAFLALLSFRADVFKKFNVDKCMHSELLCVGKDQRGKGVGLKLYEENMKLAKSRGYPLYVCDCTSLFSAKLCEKLGMTKVLEMNYNEYCDENGNAIFHKVPSHDIARVYAKLL